MIFYGAFIEIYSINKDLLYIYIYTINNKYI